MASSDPAPSSASYSTDPALYIYTSLTAGSSHIVTATSRLETILRANRVPFKAIDIATDEKARMLWGRRAGKDESGRVRKLPGLVQMGMVLGVSLGVSHDPYKSQKRRLYGLGGGRVILGTRTAPVSSSYRTGFHRRARRTSLGALYEEPRIS